MNLLRHILGTPGLASKTPNSFNLKLLMTLMLNTRSFCAGEKRLSAPVLSCGVPPNEMDRRHSHCVHPEHYPNEWDSSSSDESSDSDYTDDEDEKPTKKPQST